MQIDLMRGLHGLVGGCFKIQGLKWEVRRAGDMQIGYWKWKLRKKSSKRTIPRRIVLIPGFGDPVISWYPTLMMMRPWLTDTHLDHLVPKKLLKKVLPQEFLQHGFFKIPGLTYSDDPRVKNTSDASDSASLNPNEFKREPTSQLPYDEIILVDLPGFNGFLGNKSAFPSLNLLVEAVGDLLDALRPTVLIGHSLGGWLSTQYAADCGRGVRPKARSFKYEGPETVILNNASGVFPNSKARNDMADIFDRATREGFSAVRPHMFGREPFWLSWVGDLSHFFKRPDIVEFIHSVAPDHTLEKEAQWIRAKVWMIWGELDTLVPLACGKALNNSLKAEKCMVVLPRAGHCPHMEQPLIMATLLGQILRSNELLQNENRWWKLESTGGVG